MIIDIQVIPHSSQRYDTCGDWYFNSDNKRLTIRVSALGDWGYEMLIGRHEMDEALLCLKRGIKEKDVSTFDHLFERERSKGMHSDSAEPGDDPRAPYRKEHFFAATAERALAAELKVDWADYEEAIQSLEYNPKPITHKKKARN